MSTEYETRNGAGAPLGNGAANGSEKTGAAAENAGPAPRKDWLGDQLRDLYSSYAEEPIPDDLASLMDKLDEIEPGSAQAASGRKSDASDPSSGNEAQ